MIAAESLGTDMRLAYGWHEGEDGVTELSVRSDGTSLPGEWASRLRQKGIVVEYNDFITFAHAFSPTKGRESRVAIVRANLFSEQDRSLRKVLEKINPRRFTLLDVEAVFLLRDALTLADMAGMRLKKIIGMHSPFVHAGGPVHYLRTHGPSFHFCLHQNSLRLEHLWSVEPLPEECALAFAVITEPVLKKGWFSRWYERDDWKKKYARNTESL